MLHFVKGNMFDCKAEALVNPVNCKGISGAGLALSFKMLFPKNFIEYRDACHNKRLVIGTVFVTENKSGSPKFIVNFPTKKDWRDDSDLKFIDSGLRALSAWIKENAIKSIAIPKLGCGCGHLPWLMVKELIIALLGRLDCDIYIYE